MNFFKFIILALSLSFSASHLFAQSKDITKLFRAESSKTEERGMDDLGADNTLIVIQKAALGEEFLLQANFVFQNSAPSFEGMRSKIVTFKRRANRVVLEENMSDSIVASGIPATKLLAVFPITAETADELTFDWASGFNALLYSGDWFASDFYWYGADAFSENSVDVVHGYVDEALFENNILDIRYLAQIKSATWWGSSIDTLEIRWYLKPYEINPNFTPTESKGFDRYGFFEANPLVRPDHKLIHATKFDASKPIVYAISANTPAEYREAVRDGILYWNKAMGSEVIQVVDAPANVTAPNPHYNMVQWINWDNAGFAYADAQMDPRTGEILHAQVFLTSAFAISGQKRAAMLLQGFNGEQNFHPRSELREAFKAFDFKTFNRNSFKDFKKSKAIETPILKGFERGELCFRDNTQQLEMALADFIARGLSDKEILKVSQDYVREVVAHEIGHTLGLRHNFAGSLSANFSADQRPALYAKYLSEGHTPEGTVASSSVMEYQRFEESTMTGDQIRTLPSTLNYDDKAIKILYNGATFANNQIPLFCTDSHAYLYNDCQVFDSGSSPFAWSVQEFKDNQSLAAKRLAIKIIMWATHPAAANRSIDEMLMEPFSTAWYMTDPLWNQIFGLLSMSYPLLQVERQYDHATQWNYSEILRRSKETNVNYLNSMGGLNALFPALNPRQTENILSELRRLLSDAQFTSAMSYGPKPFSFSAEEVDHIMSLANVGFSKISHLAITDQMIIGRLLGVIDMMLREFPFFDVPVSLAGVDTNIATTIVGQKDGIAFSGSLWVPNGFFGIGLKEVSIPNYSYNFQERLTAASFAVKPSLSIADAIKADMVAAFGLKSADEISKLNLASMPPVVAEWVHQNNTIIAELSKVPAEQPSNWWDL